MEKQNLKAKERLEEGGGGLRIGKGIGRGGGEF
jgi:hypothetical protein